MCILGLLKGCMRHAGANLASAAMLPQLQSTAHTSPYWDLNYAIDHKKIFCYKYPTLTLRNLK